MVLTTGTKLFGEIKEDSCVWQVLEISMEKCKSGTYRPRLKSESVSQILLLIANGLMMIVNSLQVLLPLDWELTIATRFSHIQEPYSIRPIMRTLSFMKPSLLRPMLFSRWGVWVRVGRSVKRKRKNKQSSYHLEQPLDSDQLQPTLTFHQWWRRTTHLNWSPVSIQMTCQRKKSVSEIEESQIWRQKVDKVERFILKI